MWSPSQDCLLALLIKEPLEVHVHVASVKINSNCLDPNNFFFLREGLGLLPGYEANLRQRASNDMRDHTIIGGVVPNHRSRVAAIQDVVLPRLLGIH